LRRLGAEIWEHKRW